MSAQRGGRAGPADAPAPGSGAAELAAAPWRLLPDGIALAVWLTPKSGHEEIGGLARVSDNRSALKARVRAAPHDGEANAALIRLAASAFGVAARDVRIEAGAASRLKTLVLRGDPAALIKAVRARMT